MPLHTKIYMAALTAFALALLARAFGAHIVADVLLLCTGLLTVVGVFSEV